MIHPLRSQSKRRWLTALLIAMMTLLPSLPVGAAMPAAQREDEVSDVVFDPGNRPSPFRNRSTQLLPVVQSAITPPIAATAPITNVLEVTATVQVTTTVTATTTAAVAQATPQSEVAPANDAYQAWNSRPAVKRANAYPVRVHIPSLAIDTFVEQLGERADGSMATPTNPGNVAWYSYGAIPGENGNVVMAGHLDRADGSPAIFWDLEKIKVGDEVITYDSTQTAYHYVVTDQQSYPYDKAPLDEIFGFDLVSRLNLITCRGNWDRNRQTYSQRLVVYTELVKIVPAGKP